MRNPCLNLVTKFGPFREHRPESAIALLSKPCKSKAELKQFHAQIILSRTISFCVDHGELTYTNLAFSRIGRPNTFVNNTMMRIYINSNNPSQALLFYLKMKREKSTADRYTFPLVLKACTLLQSKDTGKVLHGCTLKLGFSFDLFVQSGLIRFYAECGFIDCSRRVFDEILERDIVIWNTMIGGYMKHGLISEAIKLFNEMPAKNIGSFNTMLSGYAKFGELENAKKVFDQMPERDVISWNSMVMGHAKYGSLDVAREIFDQIPRRNVSSWANLISGLAQRSEFVKALETFVEMQRDTVRPNQAILVSILSSCAHLGALDQGIWVHAYLEKCMTSLDDIVCASLVDMYSKCGFLEAANIVFNKTNPKGVCGWTAMILGLAIHGQSDDALRLFDKMPEVGMRPNGRTCLAALSACVHAGFVDKGHEILDTMHRVHNVRPELEHYTCVIDLLSRANLFDEAQELVRTMPFKPDAFVWGALLSGFRIHRSSTVSLSEDMGREMLRLGAKDSGPFVSLSNIYASCERWEDVTRLRTLMGDVGVRKNPGCSLIEVNGEVHEFLAGERSHPQCKEIYHLLDGLSRHIYGNWMK
ncbi:hypothetical protein AMTRI_Chr07g24860 [Amborella trichopoda]